MPTRDSSDSQRTVAFFDSIAADYEGLYDEKTPGGYPFAVRLRRVLELFDKPGGKVLDVGCGPGLMAKALTAQGCSFWGIDPSERMIEQGKRKLGAAQNVELSVGDAQKIEYPDASFDAVICMGVLERVPDDGLALREMLRVLKEGGTLIVTLPNRISPYLLWRDLVFYPIVALMRPLYFWLTKATRRPVIPGHRLYSERSYVETVSSSGAQVTEVVYCVYNFFLPPLESFFPGLCTAAMKRTEWLHKGFLRKLGCSFIVKARKRVS